MNKLIDYVEIIERLLKQENDIVLKFDKSKNIIKLQYFMPRTIKLEGSKHE